VVICLELGADIHMAQLMPLPLAISCFSKIQTGFTFLVPAYPGCPGQRAVKRVCVCGTKRRYVRYIPARELFENNTNKADIISAFTVYVFRVRYVLNAKKINNLYKW